MLLDRLAIYGVPALAGLLTTAVLLGPASERPALGVRVRGLVAKGASTTALRLEAIEYLRGTYRAVPLPPSSVTLKQGAQRSASWHGKGRGSSTEVELSLSRPAEGSLDIDVTSAGKPLAKGQLKVHPPLDRQNTRTLAQSLDGQWQVAIVRGMAMAPFPEKISVSVRHEDAPNTSARPDGAEDSASDANEKIALKAAARGAAVAQPPTLTNLERDEAGLRAEWLLEVTPQALAFELELALLRDGKVVSHWSKQLPQVAGGLWLDPKPVADERLERRIVSSSTHAHAYVSLLAKTGRLWGAKVPLSALGQGMSHGQVVLPSAPPDALLVLSSTPDESPDTSVAWPLDNDGHAVARRYLDKIADGMPAAIAREKTRQRRMRRPVYGLVVAACLFELVYLWLRNRSARTSLQAHVGAVMGQSPNSARASSREFDEGSPLWWLVLLVGSLVLLFAALAAVAAFA